MITRYALAPVTMALAAAAPIAPAPERHVTGSFDVTITPEAQSPAPPGGIPTARMALAKTFTGGIAGTMVGTMLAAGTPAPGQAASYVAIDQFSGTVERRRGGFLLTHRGTMTKDGVGALDVAVSPDSGTGDLSGITGTLTITIKGGRHFYDFAYRLPPR